MGAIEEEEKREGEVGKRLIFYKFNGLGRGREGKEPACMPAVLSVRSYGKGEKREEKSLPRGEKGRGGGGKREGGLYSPTPSDVEMREMKKGGKTLYYLFVPAKEKGNESARKRKGKRRRKAVLVGPARRSHSR